MCQGWGLSARTLSCDIFMRLTFCITCWLASKRMWADAGLPFMTYHQEPCSTSLTPFLAYKSLPRFVGKKHLAAQLSIGTFILCCQKSMWAGALINAGPSASFSNSFWGSVCVLWGFPLQGVRIHPTRFCEVTSTSSSIFQLPKFYQHLMSSPPLLFVLWVMPFLPSL